jgi:hypothetical protein
MLSKGHQMSRYFGKFPKIPAGRPDPRPLPWHKLADKAAIGGSPSESAKPAERDDPNESVLETVRKAWAKQR